MRQFHIDDPVTRARLELWPDGLAQQLLRRAEARLVESRANPAIRAARDGPATQGGLGPLLMGLRRRLLRLAVKRATPA
jgi:hypothetical protein